MVFSTCENGDVSLKTFSNVFPEIGRNGDPPSCELLFWKPAWDLIYIYIIYIFGIGVFIFAIVYRFFVAWQFFGHEFKLICLTMVKNIFHVPVGALRKLPRASTGLDTSLLSKALPSTTHRLKKRKFNSFQLDLT